MLIKGEILKRIKRGEVTLAFRRWRRPTVKAGGSLNTSVGVLTIENVERISVRDISDTAAHQAGYSGREALLKDLGNREGDLFRITLAYSGEDPRIKLREDNQLADAELAEVCQRLRRLDSVSRVGEWTHDVLVAIHQHPRLPAADLAKQTGYEKDWLKTNVRKLKALGLTISQQVGYTLSPRGIAVLDRLERDV